MHAAMHLWAHRLYGIILVLELIFHTTSQKKWQLIAGPKIYTFIIRPYKVQQIP